MKKRASTGGGEGFFAGDAVGAGPVGGGGINEIGVLADEHLDLARRQTASAALGGDEYSRDAAFECLQG
jgi:hypothetical protein